MEGRELMTALPRGFVRSVAARGLTEPTGVVAVTDGRLFVLQQTGQIRVIQNGRLLPAPLLQVNTDFTAERGLDGIALDPNFLSNHYIYIYYTVPGNPAHNRVSRFTLSGNTAVPGSEVPLLDLPPLGDTHHNGGSLQFGADGKLYVAVGENMVPSNSQSLATPLGKILRINPDGSIPTDNPFYNQTTGINRAIWAIGLRNPFSTSVQPGTGLYYINDVGLDTWEKIDKGVAGANYGWPITENASGDPRFANPLYAYAHGPNDRNGAAITAGVFYDPARAQFPPTLVGRYFFGDIKGWIKTYNPATGVVNGFANGLPTVLDGLTVDAGGSLYALSRGRGANTGVLLRFQFRRR
jgi:glucose/arabinose dehydrogenase